MTCALILDFEWATMITSLPTKQLNILDGWSLICNCLKRLKN